MVAGRGPGRRPGAPDTRGQILAAARTSFADRGFERTTMRGIAAAAGVTPGLVHHFFGAKDDLFLEALAVPFDPRRILRSATAGPPDGLGERLAAAFLHAWDDDVQREPLLAFLRAAMTSPSVAALVRSGMPSIALGELGEHVSGPDATLRVELTFAQLLGVAVLRYLIGIEPVASLPADELARRLGPALQHHLLGEPAGRGS